MESWGHEYLRGLSGQLGSLYNKKVENGENCDAILGLVDIIIPNFINHNEEPEAVDLMMETETLSKLCNYTTKHNYDRVCRYLCSCS